MKELLPVEPTRLSKADLKAIKAYQKRLNEAKALADKVVAGRKHIRFIDITRRIS